jgi:hypothetical protein
MARGRHQKRYSVISITLRYVFALSHNASKLRRKVIASYIYRSGLIYSYRSGLLGIVIAAYSYHGKVIKALSLLTIALLTGLSLLTTVTLACGRKIRG